MTRARESFASAVVVAAGKGERFGATDKVLRPLAGQPVLAWTLEALEASETVADVVVVAGEHTLSAIRALIDRGNWTKARTVVTGGARRQDSVLAGLRATAEREVVLIHDAARPLATAEQFDACALAARGAGGAIIARPVSDTLKRVGDDGEIETTVPRDHLWAAQTPQGFRRQLLLDAFDSPLGQSGSFTDEASLFEALGRTVRVVRSGGLNLKLTLPEDLPVVEALLLARLARVEP
jgi:2-C-methyl-D-erythritol 4-phosphate cytidylyltransferase